MSRPLSGDQLRTAAAFLGATGVALGAFGAHGLKHRLTGPKLENWKTAVLYQLFHAVAVLSVSVLCDQQEQMHNDASNIRSTRKDATTILKSSASSYERAGQCMALGSLLFSGSIYMLCLDVGPKKLWGPTTPIGGLFMIAGWTMLGWRRG